LIKLYGKTKIFAWSALLLIFIVTLLSARHVYRDNLPKQKLIADLNAAMALNNDAADTDFFVKQDVTRYFINTDNNLTKFREIVRLGRGVTWKKEKQKPFILLLVFDGKTVALQGNYLILPDYGENAAIKITDGQNEELLKIMETFTKK